ncbi:hypothetical protein F5X97DRAFT_141098 [Nemania serpens]|nr:hypothetical protein F5X97DRAFT_141098 [Nemania serpens]
MSEEKIQNQDIAWSDTATNMPESVNDNNESQSSGASHNTASLAQTQPAGSTVSTPVYSDSAENDVTLASLPTPTERVSLSTSQGKLVDMGEAAAGHHDDPESGGNGTAVGDDTAGHPRDSNASNSHVVVNSVTQGPSFAGSFHFRSLPPEIRLMVWHAVLSDGRALVLYSRRQPASELECTPPKARGCVPFVPFAPLGPHVLFSVNIESRIEAFTFKPKRLMVESGPPFSHPVLTWLDPIRDWVCVEVYDGILNHDFPYDFSFLPSEDPVDTEITKLTKSTELTDITQSLAIIHRSRGIDEISWMVRNIFEGGFHQIQNLAMIYNVITLHSPASEIWGAGLIHHGDTHIVVDVANTVRLRQFYHFYITASRCWREKNIRLLDMLMLPEGRLRYEQYLVNDIKEKWLLAQYQEVSLSERIRFGLHSRPLPPRAWWDDREWEEWNGTTRRRSELEPAVGRNEYVDGLLERFPKFRVMVMFRICSAPVCDEAPEIGEIDD